MSMTAAPRLPGLSDPVLDSQALFRSVLAAFSRPGTVQPLPALPEAPAPLAATTGAVLLALADLDAGIWLDPATRTDETERWLRFHCGAPVLDTPKDAPFAVLGDAATLVDVDAFALGTPEYPDRAATVIVQVSALTGGPSVTLRGPGIQDTARITVQGPAAAFWEAWTANGALFPQGIDVLFAGPDAVLGLPRTTRATPED